MNKHVFIATLTLLMFISVCLLTPAADANPNIFVWPQDPITTPINVNILSPRPDQIYANNVVLIFDVIKPNSWLGGGYGLPPGCAVARISYNLDSGVYTQIFNNYGKQDGLNQTTQYSFLLKDLAEGQHVIEIIITAMHFYADKNAPQFGSAPKTMQDTKTFTVTFTMDKTAPFITQTSIANQTYADMELPLNFTVKNQAVWMGYSLDNQANVTVNGNSTLTGLTEGPHSIVLYANNTAGTACKSNLVFFAVTMPTPTPTSPSPSSSPSTTSTAAETENQTDKPPPTDTMQIWLAALAGLVLATALLGVLLYAKRRRNSE